MSLVSDEEVTKTLNAFQRDARAALEELLPFLHRPGLYPDAIVEGWGDSRGGRPIASTVVLLAPKGVRPGDRTKQLVRTRLDAAPSGELTVTVMMVGQADATRAWPPKSEPEWWVELRERSKAELARFRGSKAPREGDAPA